MRSAAFSIAVALIGAMGASGCAGTALFTTARTVPKHEVRFTAGVGVTYNSLVGERGFAVNNIPVQLGLRVGLTDQLDLGVRSLSAGLLVDAKYNFVRPDSPFALALMGGVGGVYGGTDIGQTSAVHVPLSVVASYDVGPLTPYAAAGYGAWWFVHPINREPGVTYARRTGTGDGTVDLKVGLELRVARRVALLVEYGYSHPVVDDPGDNFALVPTHLFATGVRF